jgi:electron-transferring-flavoprotein dehydrogenase
MRPLRRVPWNCSQANPEDSERMNVTFRAGTGGLHSAEN